MRNLALPWVLGACLAGGPTLEAADDLAAAGVRIAPPTREHRQLAARLLARGDGGGGDVTELEIAQTRFEDSVCGHPDSCGGPCAQVLLTWTERTLNPLGSAVSIDGTVVGTVPGIEEDDLPGIAVVVLDEVAPGEHTFRVEEGNLGGFEEIDFEVLAEQPFADIASVDCVTGRERSTAACELLARWWSPPPHADSYLVSLDGSFLTEVAAPGWRVPIPGLPPGPYCVDVQPTLRSSSGGTYVGCPVADCIELRCEELDCSPPVDLFPRQVGYGVGPSNVVILEWLEGEPDAYPDGAILTIDGRMLGRTDPGLSDAGLVLPAGLYFFGVSGDCGDGGLSPLRERPFHVLNITPHPAPIEGEATCEYDADRETATVRWTLEDPSAWIEVLVDRPGDGLVVEQILSGRRSRTVVESTADKPDIFLQFFVYRGGLAYGSELVPCAERSTEVRYFIRGACDGATGEPRITSAIFGLEHLFQGGEEPPCQEACDVNSDGSFNLADMVFLLVYLFQGGPPPAGWSSPGGGEPATPACTRVTERMDCAVSLAECPF